MVTSIQRGQFVPMLRLFSGKVFKDDGTDQTEFVERSVEEAVKYFQSEYGCCVFNFSYGDLNKVYDGRHLRGLAYTLDHLSRTLGVLFVVPRATARCAHYRSHLENDIQITCSMLPTEFSILALHSTQSLLGFGEA